MPLALSFKARLRIGLVVLRKLLFEGFGEEAEGALLSIINSTKFDALFPA